MTRNIEVSKEIARMALRAKKAAEALVIMAEMRSLGYSFEMHVGTDGMFLSRFYLGGYAPGLLQSGETFCESVCRAALEKCQ